MFHFWSCYSHTYLFQHIIYICFDSGAPCEIQDCCFIHSTQWCSGSAPKIKKSHELACSHLFYCILFLVLLVASLALTVVCCDIRLAKLTLAYVGRQALTIRRNLLVMLLSACISPSFHYQSVVPPHSLWIAVRSKPTISGLQGGTKPQFQSRGYCWIRIKVTWLLPIHGSLIWTKQQSINCKN